MPLNTIQSYVKGQLDQLALPQNLGPLPAYITPPVTEELDGPKCYVWGGTLTEARQTMPRGMGFKTLAWVVDIYLVYGTSAESATVDQDFPLIIDAVMQCLRTLEMPVPITDPETGQASQLRAIGERMDLEYPPERTPATLRSLLYSCRIGAHVEEGLQA